MQYQKVLKQIEKLSTAKKVYTIQRTITGNYHLMKGDNFIVIDESLQVISIVISALMRDRKKNKSTSK